MFSLAEHKSAVLRCVFRWLRMNVDVLLGIEINKFENNKLNIIFEMAVALRISGLETTNSIKQESVSQAGVLQMYICI